MKRVCAFICATLALALLLFTACSTQNTTSVTLDPQNTVYENPMYNVVVAEDGIYYLHSQFYPFKVMYYEFKAQTSLPLCSDPQCDHTDYETCVAAFDYHVGALYLNKTRNRLQAVSPLEAEVYAIMLDGSSRKSVGDMELVEVTKTHTNFYGTLMMNDDITAYSIFQKDGSAALYILPLYKNASAQKIYETASTATEVVGDYSVDTEIYMVGLCGDIVIFHEDSMISAPADVTEEELGRPFTTRTLKYCCAGMDEPVTIGDGYYQLAPYGDKYLISGDAGFAVWDPATNEVSSIEMPQEIQEKYEEVGNCGPMYYSNGKYYLYFHDMVSSTTPGTIFVLDEQINITNIITTQTDVVLKFNDEYIVAVGTDHNADSESETRGEYAAWLLPKTKLEQSKEITWNFAHKDNVLK